MAKSAMESNGGALSYSSNMLNPSETGFYPLISAAVTRTGKNKRDDELIALFPDKYQYGPKGKHRSDGVEKEGDGVRPDSIRMSMAQRGRWMRDGNILTEYTDGSTLYAVLREGHLPGDPKIYKSVPENNHVLYVALNHDGAMKTREALLNYSPLTILLYTKPEVLRRRLQASTMSEEEIVQRYRSYKKDYAQFLMNTSDYVFLWHVREPPLPDNLYLESSARQKAKAEIHSDALGIHNLIETCTKLIEPQMSYYKLHKAFIDRITNTLFHRDLDNLGRKLKDGPIQLDLKEQIDAFSKSGNYLTEFQQKALSEINAYRLVNRNDRYTLFLKGIKKGPFENGDTPTEDFALDFAIQKAGVVGKPTEIQYTKDQTAIDSSSFGLVKIPREDVTLKQCATYSLGHTDLVDNVHPSLTLAFLYPENEGIDLSTIPIIGLEHSEVLDLERRLIIGQ